MLGILQYKMYRVLIISISFIYSVNSYDTSDYEENTPRPFIEKLNEQDGNEEEVEPTLPAPTRTVPGQNNVTIPSATLDIKNIMCEDFEEYARNCTEQAKSVYNSTRTLPLPHELNQWCSALKRLARCEYDWNTDCKDVTEKNFNELIIQGQLNVFDKVCHDDWFSLRYDRHLEDCILAISKDWTACFLTMKSNTDHRKNTHNNWMHYETHFYLCCARTRFRRCTLDVLLKYPLHCKAEHTIVLQKFSAIISEGEVFQDCNFNMVYSSCPGGDPRPPASLVTRLIGHDPRRLNPVDPLSSAALHIKTMRSLTLIMLCFYYMFK